MKSIKKLMASILCIILFASFNVVEVQACEKNYAEQYEIISNISQGVSEVGSLTELVSQNARGISKPITAHDWNEGRMNISGNTSVDTTLYTNKYFTDFTEGYFYISAASSYEIIYPRYDVTVRMYKKGLLSDELIFERVVKAGEELNLHIWNYDPNKKYYLEFSGIFYINGYVSRTN